MHESEVDEGRQVALTGEPLSLFQDKIDPQSDVGLSQKQKKYIIHHKHKAFAKKLTGEELQRDRGLRYCEPSNAQKKADERTAKQVAQKKQKAKERLAGALRKCQTVWFPEGFSKEVTKSCGLDALPKVWKKSQNLTTCDVIAVPCLSNLHATKSGSAGPTLSFEAFCARLLGKRVATKEWFNASMKRRATVGSVKCVAACGEDKKGLVITDEFKRHHPREMGAVEKAFTLKRCRWQSIKPGDEPSFKKRKIPTVHVDRLADLHELILGVKASCDRERSTANGKFVKVSRV